MDDQPAAAWHPSADVIAAANVTAVCRQLGLPDYAALHRWSVVNRDRYWDMAIRRLGIPLRQPYERILDAAEPTRPRWLVGSRMNIVDACFGAADGADAIVESDGAGPPRRTSYGQLRRDVEHVAGALAAAGVGPGDAVGVVLPMSGRSVAAYLAVISVGAAVVSIADSFAAGEIAIRLRIANAGLVITQPAVAWGGKRLPLYEKVAAAGDFAVVVACDPDECASIALRPGHTGWEAFLARSAGPRGPVDREPQDAINILFSSGTTGEPKAIPWDHTTPLKCAADAHFHQDLHAGDVVCWPTSLGWMMGPWLIFAALINRATVAIYTQSPLEAGFGRFVRDAGVQVLGLVPSMVRGWRQSRCMDGIDWSRIRAFSSTGECSNAEDVRFLMRLAGGRPVIEYCGGTEIGGAYATGTVVQPQVPAAFSTPALGIEIALLDEAGRPADRGEAFLVGPSIGLSTRLLNRDHDAVYFAGAPARPGGTPLRRHGDELESLGGGYFRATGRCDDTMNLGGIKVGCAEIERVLNALPAVRETAAVAVPPPGGGPSRLVVFVVLQPASPLDPRECKTIFQDALRRHLNPLFRVDEVRLLPGLPRTASNKVLRRELRSLPAPPSLV